MGFRVLDSRQGTFVAATPSPQNCLMSGSSLGVAGCELESGNRVSRSGAGRFLGKREGQDKGAERVRCAIHRKAAVLDGWVVAAFAN